MNNIFAQIQKYEKIDDDVIIVSGIASSESMDNQNEVVKSSAIRDALPDYMAIGGTGALREMHQSKAAGSVFKAEVMEDGNTLIEARVVDKDACKKIEQGVYKGFSIGGKVIKKEGNTITKVKLTEISLVDRPCNPDALFSMYKCDDSEDIEKVAERKDVNADEGEKKYGDVKFADEKNNKYPIDTEAHIRAAWNYIHQKRNAGKYSAQDASAIKGKIKAAWKRVIGGEPPSAETKKGEAYDSSQWLGLNNIGRLAAMIQILQDLHCSVEYEREMEGDDSKLPEDLTVAITNLYDILVRMSQEEFSEFNEKDIEMSDNTKDLAKATMETPRAIFDDITAKVSAIQQDQIKPTDIESLFGTLKTRLVSAGYITDAKIINPDNNVGWSNKADGVDSKSSENEDMKKMDDLKSQIESLNKRLDEMENKPAEDKVVLKNLSGDVISKTDDAKGEIQLQKVDRNKFSNLKLEDKELAALDVIKTIHTNRI